jgi:glycosyltransferase involved in cell wall biosynthesis
VNALLLKDPRNVQTLAAAIARLQSDAGFLEKISRNAAMFAAEHTWVKAASAYAQLAQNMAELG